MSRLPQACKSLLVKAQDSATQAVSTYNDPRSVFRTGNFTVLMVIAWTSLLHAYFEQQKKSYYYKKDNGRYEYVDGEKRAWELSKCVKEMFAENDPVRVNLELFIKMRNKIEHRNLPALDQELMGECQAIVLNFEAWLVDKFGDDFSMIDTMFVPIQLASSRRTLPKSKLEEKVVEFVKEYRSVLAPEVLNSQTFAFKAFLVPKIGNHRTSSDIAIEFVKYDENDPGEMEKYQKAIIAIKEKVVPVSNADLLKPSKVLEKLKDATNQDRPMSWHTAMWQKYKVRPSSVAEDKSNCKTEYCIYDSPHGDYLYTDKWVELLKTQL